MANAYRDDNRISSILVIPTNGGTKPLAVSGLNLTNAIPMHVALVDGSGNQVIGMSQETSTLYNGSTALTPQFAVINASSNGDNTIVAGVTSKQIRVLNGLIIVSANTTLFFRDGAAGTAITGSMATIANGGFQIPYSPIGNFQTSAGNALILNLSAGNAVGGWIAYITL